MYDKSLPNFFATFFAPNGPAAPLTDVVLQSIPFHSFRVLNSFLFATCVESCERRQQQQQKTSDLDDANIYLAIDYTTRGKVAAATRFVYR